MKSIPLLVALLAMVAMSLSPALAQTGTLFVQDDKVGVGTDTPASALHVRKSDGTSQLQVEEVSSTSADRLLLLLKNNGPVRMRLNNTGNAAGVTWSYFHLNNGGFAITVDGSGKQEFFITPAGDGFFTGSVTATNFSQSSSRDLKTGFDEVDVQEILERVTAIPITQWRYKEEEPSVVHIGPMAEDFHAAFGLGGADDQHISSIDSNGVIFAAIQALSHKLQERNQRIEELERQLEELRASVPGFSATDREIVPR